MSERQAIRIGESPTAAIIRTPQKTIDKRQKLVLSAAVLSVIFGIIFALSPFWERFPEFQGLLFICLFTIPVQVSLYLLGRQIPDHNIGWRISAVVNLMGLIAITEGAKSMTIVCLFLVPACLIYGYITYLAIKSEDEYRAKYYPQKDWWDTPKLQNIKAIENWNPARQMMVKSLLPGSSSEKEVDKVMFDFPSYLMKEFLAHKIERNYSHSEYSYYITAYYAAGLLTYGHLDMLEYILDAIDYNDARLKSSKFQTGSRYNWLVEILETSLSIVKWCLPIPENQFGSNQDMIKQSDLKKWFEYAEDYLIWNPELEKFEFQSEEEMNLG